MAEIINLRQVRKQRARQDKDAQAAVNRRRFGQTKGERDTAQAEESRRTRDLDGKRLDDQHQDDIGPPDDPDPGPQPA